MGVVLDVVGTLDRSLYYAYEIYYGEEKVTDVANAYNANKTVTKDMSEYINVSGDYKIVVCTFMNNADGSRVYSTKAETEYRTYTRLEASLGTTAATCVPDRAGVFQFNKVEGAAKYDCRIYRIVDGVARPHGFQTTSDLTGESSVVEADFSQWIDEEGQYYITVRALSDDINTVANGEMGPQSEILDTTVKSETVIDKAGNANAYANAAAGNNVKLAVTKPETAVILDSIYSNVVQLDLKLWCDDSNVKDLTVPITITMPIPAGVHTSNLRLMHYHDGDTVGSQVNYAISADGKYITFTVDSFSTFVFANETVQAGSGDVGQTSSEETQNTSQKTQNVLPKTGDINMEWSMLLLGVSCFGIIYVLEKKKVV